MQICCVSIWYDSDSLDSLDVLWTFNPELLGARSQNLLFHPGPASMSSFEASLPTLRHSWVCIYSLCSALVHHLFSKCALKFQPSTSWTSTWKPSGSSSVWITHVFLWGIGSDSPVKHVCTSRIGTALILWMCPERQTSTSGLVCCLGKRLKITSFVWDWSCSLIHVERWEISECLSDTSGYLMYSI